MKLGNWATAMVSGVAGVLLVVAPASAQDREQQTPPQPDPAMVTVADDCTDVLVSILAGGTDRAWRVLLEGQVALPPGVDLDAQPAASLGTGLPGLSPTWKLWLGPQETLEDTLPGASGGEVRVQWFDFAAGDWADEQRTEFEKAPCEDPSSPSPPAGTPPSVPGDGGAGAGDELAQTGVPTLLTATGALALLGLGGALFLLAWRRPVTFTS